jgi:hypothetical protein
MKPRSIFVAVLCLAVMPCIAGAQTTRKGVDVEPPRVEKILANSTSQPNEVLADLVAIKPEIPLGPLDVLKEYERDMVLVTQRMSAEVGSISQAAQTNQITREQAEYLIGQRYQVAMMQFQILSALHDALGRDMAQDAALAKRSREVRDSDTAVVVEMPSAGPSVGCK